MRVDIEMDGQTLSVTLDVTAFVKWENRAAAAGMSLSKYLSLFLNQEVQRT